MRKRKKFKQYEERRHPDFPDGLVQVAVNDRAFGERLTGVIRLRLAEAKGKKDGGR